MATLPGFRYQLILAHKTPKVYAESACTSTSHRNVKELTADFLARADAWTENPKRS